MRSAPRAATAERRAAISVSAASQLTCSHSPNYLWFSAHYPRFLYIDRIVVSASARGRGLGPALYADLIAVARNSGVDLLCCEYDLEPPNPGSARFHAGFGFREVGQQRVAGGKKSVSLQILDLPAHTCT